MLSILSLEQKDKWNEIVTSFENYDVFYLYEYVIAFNIHGEGEPLLFLFEDQDARALNVVMKRDIAQDKHFEGKLEKGKQFDLSTPYGYGGWIFDGQVNRELLFSEYTNWCIEHNVVSEFVRFGLFNNSRDYYYGEVVQRTNNIVRSLDMTIEEAMMDFEHKVRKNYKKAQAAGLEIQVDGNGSNLDAFLNIYYCTMDRNGAEDEYYFKEDFFKQISQMQGHFVYFNVLLDKKIISTELVLIGSDTMYSYLGGTDSNYFEYRPNDFLKVEIIKWGIMNHYKRFVLGGGYGADDGIFKYKKSFAPGGVVQFFTGQTIFDLAKYDHLVHMRDTDPNPSFFPQYRG